MPEIIDLSTDISSTPNSGGVAILLSQLTAGVGTAMAICGPRVFVSALLTSYQPGRGQHGSVFHYPRETLIPPAYDLDDWVANGKAGRIDGVDGNISNFGQAMACAYNATKNGTATIMINDGTKTLHIIDVGVLTNTIRDLQISTNSRRITSLQEFAVSLCVSETFSGDGSSTVVVSNPRANNFAGMVVLLHADENFNQGPQETINDLINSGRATYIPFNKDNAFGGYTVGCLGNMNKNPQGYGSVGYGIPGISYPTASNHPNGTMVIEFGSATALQQSYLNSTGPIIFAQSNSPTTTDINVITGGIINGEEYLAAGGHYSGNGAGLVTLYKARTSWINNPAPTCTIKPSAQDVTLGAMVRILNNGQGGMRGILASAVGNSQSQGTLYFFDEKNFCPTGTTDTTQATIAYKFDTTTNYNYFGTVVEISYASDPCAVILVGDVRNHMTTISTDGVPTTVLGNSPITQGRTARLNVTRVERCGKIDVRSSFSISCTSGQAQYSDGSPLPLAPSTIPYSRIADVDIKDDGTGNRANCTLTTHSPYRKFKSTSSVPLPYTPEAQPITQDGTSEPLLAVAGQATDVSINNFKIKAVGTPLSSLAVTQNLQGGHLRLKSDKTTNNLNLQMISDGLVEFYSNGLVTGDVVISNAGYSLSLPVGNNSTFCGIPILTTQNNTIPEDINQASLNKVFVTPATGSTANNLGVDIKSQTSDVSIFDNTLQQNTTRTTPAKVAGGALDWKFATTPACIDVTATNTCPNGMTVRTQSAVVCLNRDAKLKTQPTIIDSPAGETPFLQSNNFYGALIGATMTIAGVATRIYSAKYMADKVATNPGDGTVNQDTQSLNTDMRKKLFEIIRSTLTINYVSVFPVYVWLSDKDAEYYRQAINRSINYLETVERLDINVICNNPIMWVEFTKLFKAALITHYSAAHLHTRCSTQYAKSFFVPEVYAINMVSDEKRLFAMAAQIAATFKLKFPDQAIINSTNTETTEEDSEKPKSLDATSASTTISADTKSSAIELPQIGLFAAANNPNQKTTPGSTQQSTNVLPQAPGGVTTTKSSNGDEKHSPKSTTDASASGENPSSTKLNEPTPTTQGSTQVVLIINKDDEDESAPPPPAPADSDDESNAPKRKFA